MITGVGKPLIGRLLTYDAVSLAFREIEIKRNPDCPVCGEDPSITELQDYEIDCAIG
jgi:adenylyltransferase/sulfurtransferase